MPRPCTVCAHPLREEINAALEGGAALDDVITRFELPSRSALQRHRAGHLGRAVTFRLPRTQSAPNGLPEAPADIVEPEAALAALFARATATEGHSIQDYARLVVDGLAHTYAAAYAAKDHAVTVRALRELRALLQFYALVPQEKLRQHPGWAEPPQPLDPIFALERLLLAQVGGDRDAEAAALAEYDLAVPGAGNLFGVSPAGRTSH